MKLARRQKRSLGAFGGGVPLWPFLLLGGAGILFLAFRVGGIVVTTLRGITDNAVWAKTLFDVIGDVLPKLSVKTRVIIVAHAAYESGWGKATPAREANNLFNVTAGSAWEAANKPVFRQANADLSYRVEECARLGRPTTIQKNGKPACRIDQVWRRYATINSCVVDYWDFLGPNQNRGRYVKARQALERGDLAEFGQELYAAGYFTLPAQEYIASMGGVVGTVSRLLRVTV